MSNRRKIASIAFTGAAATAATMMAAGPALAASAFSIKNNGVPYTGPIKGKLKAGTTATLKDATKKTTLTCKKAAFSGSIDKDNGVTPAIVGKIKPPGRTTWSSCIGPDGLSFQAHLIGTSPNISVSQINGLGASGHLKAPPGHKISGKISGKGPFNTCSAIISGSSVSFIYVNASHEVDINLRKVSTLHVKAVTGNCAGALNVGDMAYFSGIYIVSTPANLVIVP